MNTKISNSKAKVLAISSGGGHWVELMRLSPAFVYSNMAFATVYESYKKDLEYFSDYRFYTITDVTRWNKFKWAKTTFQIVLILLKEKPEFIISTGALPGYLALRIGKYFGSKTIWLDSIANVDQLSTAGKHIGKFTDLWLTQWEHLAQEEGPFYRGAVI
jgi:UDP-N-acetylglucosamine:LPS N-acetylglucosamine transferase